MKYLFATVVSFFWLSAFAQVPDQTELTNASCAKIEAACKKAGFYLGGFNDKKGIFSDCYNLILKGSKVAKVSADDKDVKECDTFRTARAIKANGKASTLPVGKPADAKDKPGTKTTPAQGKKSEKK